MANKGAISGTSKADTAINNVQKEIRQMEKRDWLTISERSIQEGQLRAEKAKSKPETVTQVRISSYNPDSPLKGSSSWTKAQWETYKAKVKADKAQAKRDAKSSL
jgi:hypothetical protein